MKRVLSLVIILCSILQLAPGQAVTTRRKKTRAPLPPFSYYALTDYEIRPLPTIAGTEADLTVGGRGAGYKWFDLTHDVEILRVTDATFHTAAGFPNRTFGTMSGSGHSCFSKDGGIFLGLNGWNNALPFDIDEAALTATPRAALTGDSTRPIDLKNEPWFSLVANRTAYGVDTRSGHNNNLKVSQLDFTDNSYSVVMDLSTLGITFSSDPDAREGAHTAGVTSSDALPDEWMGCYWGGSSGDYDRYYSIWKRSDPAGTIRTLDCKLKRIRSAAGVWTDISTSVLDSTFPASVTFTTIENALMEASADFTSNYVVVGQKIRVTTSAGVEIRQIVSVNNGSLELDSDLLGTATNVAGNQVAILGTTIHSAQLNRFGDTVIIYKALRTNPTGSIVAVWNTKTDTFQLANNETGHAVARFGDWINNAGNADALQWKQRPLSDVTTTGLQKLIVASEPTPSDFAVAEHPAGMNAHLNRQLAPFFSGDYRYGQNNYDLGARPWRKWDDEILAIPTHLPAQTAVPYRLVHHLSDVKGDTGGLTSFWYSPRVQVNRKGTLIAWTGNHQKTLGACTGCDPGQNFRSDIFIAKLPTAAPSVANASGISVGSITNTSAVITFSLSAKGYAVARYSIDMSFGSSAKDFIIKSGSRSVTIGGLSPGTLYNVRGEGINRANVAGTTAVTSFTTTGSAPADFVTDSFTEAGSNVDLSASHAGETGADWTDHPSYTGARLTVDATTDRVFATGSTAAYASGVPSSADYYVEGGFFIASNLAGTNICITGRMDTTANTMYGVRFNPDLGSSGGQWQLFKIVSGTFTQLAVWEPGAAPTVGQTYTVRLTMTGTGITVSIDSTQRMSVTDSSITAAGRAGIRAGGTATSSTGYHLTSISAR